MNAAEAQRRAEKIMHSEYSIKKLLKDSIEQGLAMKQMDDPFDPFLNLVIGDEPTLNILIADDLDKAFRAATKIIERQDTSPRYYSIVWDGRIRMNEKKSDSLLIEIGSDSSDTAQIIAQPYAGKNPAIASGKLVKVRNTDNRLAARQKAGPFTAHEWNQLAELPVSLFLLVAGADGEIDEKENCESTSL